MPSIFTRIINGEIPSYTIAEDAYSFAFLDINPNTKGHVLCVPKNSVDQLFDLPQQEYLELMSFAKKIAKALKKAVPCKRIALSVVGLEVPHAHIHLIPLEEMDDIRFQKKVSLSPEEMQQTAEAIAAFVELELI